MALLLDEHDSGSGASVRRGSRAPGGGDLGVIKDARRRRRSRRIRVGLGAVLVVAASGSAAALLDTGGSPASRTKVRTRAGAGHRREAAAFGVRLSPALDGGQYGWCVAIEEGSRGTVAGGCSMTPVASAPVAFRMTGTDAKTHTQWTVLVTTPSVAAVLVNGRRRVPTLALPGLPYGLRAVRIVTALAGGESRINRRGGGWFREPRLAEPRIVPLARSGQPLTQRPVAIGSSGAIRRPVQAGVAATRPCSLAATGVPGLVAQWSHVAPAISGYSGTPIGHAFFSCIDTELTLAHRWLDAAILLDAAHPGSRPAAIPGFVPVSADPGYYEGSPEFKGKLTAVRSGDAWLVIAGGSSLAQRVELLRHLRPVVRLPRA
jgi:hypothetical protein